MTDGEQLELPGMRAPDERDSAMVAAAHHTINALRDANMLDERKALLVNLVLSLSAAIDAGTRAGRASAVAMAAAQLRETLLILDPPPEDTDASAQAQQLLREFMARLDAAAPRQPLQLLDGSVVAKAAAIANAVGDAPS